MASAETLINIFSDLTNEMGTIISEFESINSRLAAIDLNSPDAESLIQNLQNERSALVDRANNDFTVRYRAAAGLVNSSPALIKNQVLPTAKITQLAYENGLTLNNAVKKDLSTALTTAKANAQARADATIERQAFLEANQEPQQAELTRDQAAFLEANQTDIATEADPEVAKLNRQADEARNRGLVTPAPPAATEDDISSENARLAARAASQPPSTTRGLQAGKTSANKRAIKQDLTNFSQKHDWRVRLSLAPGADYLYKAQSQEDVGILYPLQATNGVIFPYTPQISVNYAAQYDAGDVAHTNYRIFQYKSSSVDNINVSCEFTAQDTTEAAYLLAVIHFFRSVTKMFYGQDKNAGVPPPLCYLHGLGQFQFDNHPLVVTQFNYQLPNDVDYIRTDSQKYIKGGPSAVLNTDPRSQVEQNRQKGTNTDTETSRRAASNVPKNGVNDKVIWTKADYNQSPTYVPTKILISFSAYPIVTRNDISNKFSLRDYGSGKLLQGTKNKQTGIW